MIYWLDESIVHSVLTGLMIVCVLGVSWAVYIRMWQIVLWEVHHEDIQSKLTNGYALVPLRWHPEIRCENVDGECVRWRGGLVGEIVEG